MPVMSKVEQAFCRSAPWRAFAGKTVLPWALDGTTLRGDVLEIGSGSGAMAVCVANAHPDASLTVTDIDPSMVTAARRRLAGNRNVDAVTVADVTKLPFGDESFDFVTSYLMLHHVIDWEQALGEARRVLRPGGQLFAYDLLDSFVARSTHQLDRSPYRLMKLDEIEPALAAAGFDHCRVTPSFRRHVVRVQATTRTGTER